MRKALAFVYTVFMGFTFYGMSLNAKPRTVTESLMALLAIGVFCILCSLACPRED